VGAGRTGARERLKAELRTRSGAVRGEHVRRA
jgi:hypothetical protein